MGERRRPWLLAALAYIAVTAAMTWPLIARISTAVAHDAADPVLNLWILWWNSQHVPLGAAWWNPPIFFPATGALAFSETLLGLSIFATPLIRLGLSPEAASNLLFLLSFPASGLAMHWLVHSLTGRHDGAFLAGLAFAFSPYRAAQLAHVQVLWSFWMPVALVGLHRCLSGKRWGIPLFVGAWLLQSLSNGYYLVYFTWLAILWAAWFLVRRSHARTLVLLGVGWALAAVPVLWLMLRYRELLGVIGLNRSIGEIERLSSDVLSIFSAAPESVVWGRLLLGLGGERDLFPGLTVALLTAAISIAAWRSRASLPGGPGRRGWMLVVAGVSTLVAISVPVLGAWSVRLGGVSLTVGRFHKPFTVAVIALAAYALSSRRTWAVLRERSVIAFYALAGLVMWLLSLGPAPRFDGYRIFYKAPYAWMMTIPGVDNLRVPARLGMLAMLCLAVVVGVGFARAVRWQGAKRLILAGACAAGILADGWFGPMAVASSPRPWTIPAPPPPGVVVELPLGSPNEDAAALSRMRFHGMAVVNGYSGYGPPHYVILSTAVREANAFALAAIGQLGEVRVMVDRRSADHAYWEERLKTTLGVRGAGSDPAWSAWLLSGRPLGPLFSSSMSACAVSTVSQMTGGPDIGAVHDGNLGTVWTSEEPQRGGEQLVIDLGRHEPIGLLVLSLGAVAPSWPRWLQIWQSTDGADWQMIWDGDTTQAAFAAAIRSPKTIPMEIPLKGAGRFLRLKQIGRSTEFPWAVAEIGVYRPAAP